MLTTNFTIEQIEKGQNNTLCIKLNIDEKEVLIPLIDVLIKLENMKGNF